MLACLTVAAFEAQALTGESAGSSSRPLVTESFVKSPRTFGSI
jgi:hypothetical protein